MAWTRASLRMGAQHGDGLFGIDVIEDAVLVRHQAQRAGEGDEGEVGDRGSSRSLLKVKSPCGSPSWASSVAAMSCCEPHGVDAARGGARRLRRG